MGAKHDQRARRGTGAPRLGGAGTTGRCRATIKSAEGRSMGAPRPGEAGAVAAPDHDEQRRGRGRGAPRADRGTSGAGHDQQRRGRVGVRLGLARPRDGAEATIKIAEDGVGGAPRLGQAGRRGWEYRHGRDREGKRPVFFGRILLTILAGRYVPPGVCIFKISISVLRIGRLRAFRAPKSPSGAQNEPALAK